LLVLRETEGYCWEDKLEVCVLTRPTVMHNFQRQKLQGQSHLSVKVLIEDYSMLTGYVDKHDQISTSYSMSRTQDKEVLLLPTYLVIVDAAIIHRFFGQTVTMRNQGSG
jgi:hypothetical protein